MYMVVSSANSITLVCSRFRYRSLLHNKNNNGPKQLPCGAPILTSFLREYTCALLDATLHFTLRDLELR